ncbi:MAG: reprolysin-like metallopeptidase [Maribacter sp.]
MVSKLRLVLSISILFLSYYGLAQRDYWKQEVALGHLEKSISNRFEVQKGAVFSFEEDVFKNKLRTTSFSKNKYTTVQFPNESGELISFTVTETPVLSKELAAKYPNIKSYSGYSLSNGSDKIRFSVSHLGVQGMIVHANKKRNTYLQKTSDDNYVIYNRDGETAVNKEFICTTKSSIEESKSGLTLKLPDDQQLRKYRLAVSASGEYTAFHGGTVADALAAINATVTRINEVFETDLAITLELVPNTDTVIFTDSETDPYDGNLNTQVQNTLTTNIGEENYDIGHLFHEDDANGNAGFIGAVCRDNQKGSGYAASPNPLGDTFDLDYVAHEMGHQFGANHTWSFESEGTQVQVEPGSGSTIMGYAGITGINNVALNGDDYFHYYSIFQISEYLETVSCAEIISLVNTPPVIIPIGDFIIPKSTPFALTGNATDIDMDDVLTYTWEQIDDGVVTQATFGPTNPSGANFRSQRPSTDSTRYFPKLPSVLIGNLTQTNPTVDSAWETVSDIEREMNFALTVRDNAVGGGQVVSDLMNVSVVDGAGPFQMISQATSQVYTAGTVQNIIWDVANTDKAPVNLQAVDILLSIDGGLTFPISLAENVPNDGDHKVVLPGNPTTMARIMVKARDNIFFAVNAVDFAIEATEIVLNFAELEYEVCQPNDLMTSFGYETYLGFNEEVTFSVPNPPLGLDITFSPETATSNVPVTVTFSNTGGVPEALYAIEVEASSASITKQVVLDLNVYDAVFPNAVLVAPADEGLDISANTFLEWEDTASYSSYDVEVATDSAFTNIIESSTVFSNTYTPSNLDYETTYFWRVKAINDCGEGVFSVPFRFTTIEFNCNNNVAEGLPLNISATGTPTITSSISFYDDIALADINVNIELDHTYLADLVVKLISPAGTTVVLLSSSCGDLQNINATFDDDAPNFNCIGDPAISGMVKPLGSLRSFVGESILGEWTLEIDDNAASDGGALRAFSLEICVEGAFRPDADNDGIFDDGDDLCLGTPEGVEVDLTGCPVYRFASNNFSVSLNSEACRNSDDGSINITTLESLDYEISVSGNGVNVSDNFTDTYTLGNLQAGTYNVCIGGTNGALVYEEHCFEVVITQPDVLNVTSITSFNGKRTVLTLEGSDLFNIELNGVVIQTTESEFTVNLKDGNNSLKVFTNLPCQGVYEERIFLSEKPIVYPNPFVSATNVFLGADIDEVAIEVFTVDGRLVWKQTFEVNGLELPLDFSIYPSGIYFIKFDGENIKGTSKVIKQ